MVIRYAVLLHRFLEGFIREMLPIDAVRRRAQASWLNAGVVFPAAFVLFHLLFAGAIWRLLGKT